tara:strand:+ start:46 stop:276 length:231 start_codon:yes stop_codon:yes gene_type:complete
MKAHYAGSVDYDNDQGEWEDAVFTAFKLNDLCDKMREFMGRRKNSDVFFGAYIDQNGVEKDITSKVREVINATSRV